MQVSLFYFACPSHFLFVCSFRVVFKSFILLQIHVIRQDRNRRACAQKCRPVSWSNLGACLTLSGHFLTSSGPCHSFFWLFVTCSTLVYCKWMYEQTLGLTSMSGQGTEEEEEVRVRVVCRLSYGPGRRFSLYNQFSTVLITDWEQKPQRLFLYFLPDGSNVKGRDISHLTNICRLSHSSRNLRTQTMTV